MTLKNPHPDHIVSSTYLSATCTCGWATRARTASDADALAGRHHLEHAPRLSPGEFHAACRKAEHVPFADVPHELLAFIDVGEVPERDLPDALRSYANGTGTARVTTTWDRKLGANVVALSCSFETADPVAFVEHMATVHGRTTGNWESSKLTQNGLFSNRIKTGATKPRLAEDGQPFKPSLKSIAEDLVTCDCCGLVMERRGDLAGERFAREHLAMCVGPVESVSA